MIHFYLLLNQNFAEENNLYKVGANVFKYSVTTDGRYICSTNALNEFPELFTEIPLQIIQLTGADFPAQALPNFETIEG